MSLELLVKVIRRIFKLPLAGKEMNICILYYVHVMRSVNSCR